LTALRNTYTSTTHGTFDETLAINENIDKINEIISFKSEEISALDSSVVLLKEEYENLRERITVENNKTADEIEVIEKEIAKMKIEIETGADISRQRAEKLKAE